MLMLWKFPTGPVKLHTDCYPGACNQSASGRRGRRQQHGRCPPWGGGRYRAYLHPGNVASNIAAPCLESGLLSPSPCSPWHFTTPLKCVCILHGQASSASGRYVVSEVVKGGAAARTGLLLEVTVLPDVVGLWSGCIRREAEHR